MNKQIYPGCFKHKLKNGITIIGQEMPESKSISIGLWFDSGSRDEKDGQKGITHLIEHLIFRGTSNLSAYEISTTVDRLGGMINAGTGTEYMVIYLNLLPSELREGLKLLGELISNPQFASQDLEVERKVIIEEIRSDLDDPRSQVSQLFKEAMWGSGNGLASRTTGTKESVRNIDQGQVRQRFSEMRNPSNLVLSGAGDFSFEGFLTSARDLFSDLRPAENCASPPPSSPPTWETREVTEDRNLNQTHFCIGFEGLSRGHEDRYVLEMINVILGNGMSSRLFRKVRKRLGAAYEITSHTEYYSDAGLFLVYGALKGSNLCRVKGIIEEELESIGSGEVLEKELDLAQKKTKGNLVLGLEGNQANMARLGSSEIYREKLDSVEEVLEKIEEVSRKDIRRLAAKLFRNKKPSLALIGPDLDTTD